MLSARFLSVTPNNIQILCIQVTSRTRENGKNGGKTVIELPMRKYEEVKAY